MTAFHLLAALPDSEKFLREEHAQGHTATNSNLFAPSQEVETEKGQHTRKIHTKCEVSELGKSHSLGWGKVPMVIMMP